MNKVLIPCDGSDSALRAVRHAAEGLGRSSPPSLQLLHVIEPMTAVTLSEAFAAQGLDDRFPPQAAQALQPAISALDAAGVPYTLHCRFGEPATEIAAHARETGCDAIVMGTRGRGALASLVIGSVAMRVVQQVDIPVTLVK
ncbi:universal stress protein [Massilia consociata]|uniref:Universal stress protein n=1 Tax=Massilia consociata TaxID=760117 RepID=A0ABV6FFC1_9BURK